ncbi:MAG: universal stress protein [Saprospiraceae bacterium]|nr:universal stress protein [Saprospiraceae bacterium]
MNNILIPVDFSNNAEQALLFGLHLAEKEKTKAIVLHLVSPYSGLNEGVYQIYDFSDYIDEKRNSLKEYVARLISENNISQIEVEIICESGIAADEIVNYSIEKSCGLIIMSSRGSGNISKILLGSTSQAVLSLSKIPLMILPQEFQMDKLNDRVCFATDFHLKLNKKSIQLFEFYNFLRNSNIQFVHVHSEKDIVFREKHEELVSLLFGKLQTHIKYILSDRFEESIETYMQTSESGLLVMLPHQRNFLYYLFFNGHTMQVLKKLHFPVLILYEG